MNTWANRETRVAFVTKIVLTSTGMMNVIAPHLMDVAVLTMQRWSFGGQLTAIVVMAVALLASATLTVRMMMARAMIRISGALVLILSGTVQRLNGAMDWKEDSNGFKL